MAAMCARFKCAMRQLSFSWSSARKRGGARPGAGRKKSPRSGPPHVRRERLVRRHPVHVTARFARALPSMREQVLARAIMAQIRRANSRFWRIVHFSIQATHVHLVVEIENETELARAMKGLGVRVAKSVNQVLRRKGNVVSGRYHVHPLRTPREVRHAIAYVSCNAHKHRAISSGWDPWSSAAWFEGWSKPLGEGRSDTANGCPFPWPVRKHGSFLLGGSVVGPSWGSHEDKVHLACRSRGRRVTWPTRKTWDIEIPALAKAVYPIGEPVLVIPVESSERWRVEVPPRWTVHKTKGAPVGTVSSSRIAVPDFRPYEWWVDDDSKLRRTVRAAGKQQFLGITVPH